MNDMPQQQQFGAPPPSPSGMNRLFPWIRTAATGGAIVAVAAYLFQVGLPEGWRLSSVAGDAAGDTVRHEILAMKEEKIDLERRLADATAQANMKAQADLLVMQQTLQARTESLTPVTAMAGLADFSCMAAKIVSSMTQPKGWQRGSGDDLYYASQQVGAATCGMGNSIRQGVEASQIEAVRTAAGSRGAPMTNGAVQASAEDQLEARALEAVDKVTTASKHYDYTIVERAQKWVAEFPANVQAHMKANLPSNTSGWDIFVDRAVVLSAALNLKN